MGRLRRQPCRGRPDPGQRSGVLRHPFHGRGGPRRRAGHCRPASSRRIPAAPGSSCPTARANFPAPGSWASRPIPGTRKSAVRSASRVRSGPRWTSCCLPRWAPRRRPPASRHWSAPGWGGACSNGSWHPSSAVSTPRTRTYSTSTWWHPACAPGSKPTGPSPPPSPPSAGESSAAETSAAETNAAEGTPRRRRRPGRRRRGPPSQDCAAACIRSSPRCSPSSAARA